MVGPSRLIRLRTEHRVDPVGIDSEHPRFGWAMESNTRGQKQTACRILVASSLEKLAADDGDLWDSGKVSSDASVALRYAGGALRSGQFCAWKVMAWDKDNHPIPWSLPATFITGKLKPEDWRGNWIGADADTNHAAVYLRKQITVDQPVKRATVFFCGLGIAELFVEGRKVGNDVLGPGFTTYDKRVQYQVFDVTGHLGEIGRKALGVILADGWYGVEKDPWVHKFETRAWVDKPKLRLDLQLEFADGTKTTIVSDETWRWSGGEITRSWIAREDIDLRKAQPGWNRAGHDESAWETVAVVSGPAGVLVSQKEPPCRIIGEVKPVSCSYDATAGKATYEFGREITGWVRFRAKGAAGTELTVTTVPSEPRPRPSTFILGGRGAHETYEPRFFYAGMRRVEVTGLKEAPSLDDLVVRLVSSSWERSGGFRCSDDTVNWLHESARRTIENYTTWLPNDPVREWKGWVQDIEGTMVASVYTFDSQTIYERWQHDMLDCQRGDGNCTQVAPGGLWDEYNSPWWGGCIVWLPWHWYLYYGDDSLLEKSLPAMKRYVDYLDRVAKAGMQDWGLGDWLPVEETPRAIANTPAHFLYAQIVSQTCARLGQTEDARRFAAMGRRVCDAFNKRYLDPATGIYGEPGWVCRQGNSQDTDLPHRVWWSGNRPCTQTGQVLPLALGMVPTAARPAVEQALLREIEAHGNRVSSGFVATPYLLRILADLAPDKAWDMTTARDYPSWYSMTAGAGHDLMKETWGGGQALMPSLGGNILGWNVESLGGIRPDPDGPGFKKILIKPNLPSGLHWVECAYDSVQGRIASRWRKRGQQCELMITIPANATATVFVPAKDALSVTEGGQPVAKAQGVKLIRTENGAAVFAVESGSYRFQSKLNAENTAP
jgi:alpha-L-rhamnosidase